MSKTPQSSRHSSKAHSDTTSPTTDDSDEKAFDPTRSREEAKIYDEAQDLNREHDFVQAIVEARAPAAVAVTPPPPSLPPAMVEQTKLEMEVGARRVMEFASQEIERQEAHERHKRDKWADKGSVEVFRPPDYVPDQAKGQGNIKATSAPLKE